EQAIQDYAVPIVQRCQGLLIAAGDRVQEVYISGLCLFGLQMSTLVEEYTNSGHLQDCLAVGVFLPLPKTPYEAACRVPCGKTCLTSDTNFEVPREAKPRGH
ncbi:MAG TPA: hypothetical protein VFH31_03150, partial [Pyrinomonadaceae bacterium]|nr:hypothetical protein [Pyrinomonadaceae bacterium]